MRKSIDGLFAVVKDTYGLDPYSNSLFLFCGRRADRLKALVHDKLSAYFCYPHIFSFLLKMIGFKDLFLKNVRITLSTAGHRGGQARLRHQAILVPRLPMR
ncbi:MAG: IS66 family insertion sequence element accessory protein TnpB [Eubacteriaceae bacterium]|nr:IS66 family insertion sequence element accessory protein TnpB [Eubacteriaceae bacterium]